MIGERECAREQGRGVAVEAALARGAAHERGEFLGRACEAEFLFRLEAEEPQHAVGCDVEQPDDGFEDRREPDLERDHDLAGLPRSASAMFFGTSSPRIMEISVAMATARTAATGKTRPSTSRARESRRQQAGEARFERVPGEQGGDSDAELGAREMGRRDLQRTDGDPEIALAALRPDLEVERSRLTRANSEATKNPVPIVSTRPATSSSHSGIEPLTRRVVHYLPEYIRASYQLTGSALPSS